ncbi:methyltransferase domain-containing protein [Pseudonocardia lacus]|uniref:methyltransferase domain-containing protein n=1 Tax=Pseudonocardia lacus TaxID=2835865 RepID=UPI0027E31308|nr:methyltransferase domain-containing protein [Pseudonocardia lacus]
MPTPPASLARLDLADALPAAARLRARSYDLLAVPPGAAVVDVGCGSGLAVAELVARGVRAIGVDPDPAVLAVAAGRRPGHDFRRSDAYALPLADGEVAGYRADKVFHLLDDPARALAEARRVLAPGGRVVLTGQDWDAIVVDSDDPGTTRALLRARADAMPAPRSARAYRATLLDNGFTDVMVEARVSVFTDPAVALPMLEGYAGAPVEGAGAWMDEQRRRARDGRVLVAVPVFLAAATAPGAV